MGTGMTDAAPWTRPLTLRRSDLLALVSYADQLELGDRESSGASRDRAAQLRELAIAIRSELEGGARAAFSGTHAQLLLDEMGAVSASLRKVHESRSYSPQRVETTEGLRHMARVLFHVHRYMVARLSTERGNDPTAAEAR
jgi:hypothetical protein